MPIHLGSLTLHAPRLHSRSRSRSPTPAAPSIEEKQRAAADAARKCFLCNEIYEVILYYVWNDGAPGARRTLLSLALTSRKLTDGAIARLWWELDSVAPLLHNTFLPEDADMSWYGGYPPFGVLQWYLGDITTGNEAADHAVARMDCYAKHVHSLSWDNYKDREWLNELRENDFPWAYTPTRRIGVPLQPVFPNLEQLIWREDRPEYFDLFRIFVTPGLRRLLITSEAEGVHERNARIRQAAGFFEELEARKVSLEALSMHITATRWPDSLVVGSDDMLEIKLKSFLARQPKLLDIGINVAMPSPYLLEHFNGRALVEIQLSLHGAPDVRNISLPQLRRLDISFIMPTRDTTIFMKGLTCPKLAQLHLQFGIAPMVPEDPDRFRSPSSESCRNIPDTDKSLGRITCEVYNDGVCAADYFRTIDTLELTYGTYNYQDRNTHSKLDEKALLEAVCKRPPPRVTTLAMEFSCFRLSGPTMLTLARGFGAQLECLQVTRIAPEWHRFAVEKVGFREVFAMLQGMPVLRSLTMSCYTPHFVEVDVLELRGIGPPHTALRRWNILDGTVNDDVEKKLSDKDLLARLVKECFPNLQRIDYLAGVEKGPRWEAINAFLLTGPQPVTLAGIYLGLKGIKDVLLGK